jgi:hypothetical protein
MPLSVARAHYYHPAGGPHQRQRAPLGWLTIIERAVEFCSQRPALTRALRPQELWLECG